MGESLPLAIYHRLPPVAQSAAATLRGLVLRRWRYGRETEPLVEEALEREQWSATRWDAWRQERLAFVLQRAATRVPYYRNHWRQRRMAGDRRSWERLEHWPILAKADLRLNPRAFLADDCRPSQMFHEHTSGTTGTPIDLWWSRRTVREWYALFELRCRRWHGVSLRDRWAIVGGQLVVPVARTSPPFWVWNAALKQLYMSAYHLSPSSMGAYLDALRRYRVSYVWGYPSALFELAQYALQSGVRGLDLKVALTNAEPVAAYQRDIIQRGFECAVRETYGMAEIVTAASECPDGRLHAWPEVGVAEVRGSDGPVVPGTSGELVATSLLNADMPLIRYAVGDRIAESADSPTCRCGRHLPGVASIHGRSDDTLIANDGRRLVRLDPIFKAGLAIHEAQVIQESFTQLRVRYVPAPGFGRRDAARLREAILAHAGEFDIVLEPVSQVPRGANGKFRAVVCAIPPADRTQSIVTEAQPT